MPTPMEDLDFLATELWARNADKFAAEWHYMYNFYYESNFATAIIDAFTDLAVAFEYESALAAVSAADTVQIGRDLAVSTWDELWFLRTVQLPDLAGWAERRADEFALLRALEAEQWSWVRIVHEAQDRAIGDLRERLALDVAIAQEHADMVTRIAIEANDRIAMVVHEAQDRARGDEQIRADLTALIARDVQQLTGLIDQVRVFAQSIPGLEDQRAVNGYNPTLRARAGTLQRLIDTLAAHDPLIAGLVGDLARFIIDLAEIDNPLVRLAAQFIIRQVIDHLGLDTALRVLTADLLGGILGTGPPKTLTEVTAAIGGRLNAAEGSVAALSPLAGEADALHEMGTLAFDAALLAFLAAGVTEPRAWADDTYRVLNTVAGPVLDPLLRLLGAP